MAVRDLKRIYQAFKNYFSTNIDFVGNDVGSACEQDELVVPLAGGDYI